MSTAALKTSEVWAKLSRFGTPWPPFDFGSGMGIEDIDRDEAIALGVLGEDEEVEPSEAKFNDELQASAKNLRPEFRDILKTHFGPQIEVEGDVVKWQSDQGKNYEQQRITQAADARRVHESLAGAFEPFTSAHRAAGVQAEILSLVEGEWRAQLAAVASGRKPLFHESFQSDLAGEIGERLAAALRASLPESVAVRTDGTHVFAWRPDVLRLPFEEIRNQEGIDGGELVINEE